MSLGNTSIVLQPGLMENWPGCGTVDMLASRAGRTFWFSGLHSMSFRVWLPARERRPRTTACQAAALLTASMETLRNKPLEDLLAKLRVS